MKNRIKCDAEQEPSSSTNESVQKKFVLTEPSEKRTTLNSLGNVYIKKYRSDVGTHLYHRNADAHQ